MGIVLREPQCCQGGPCLAAFAVRFAEFGDSLLGALFLAETYQDVQQQSLCGRDVQVRGCEVPGQLLGGLEGGQRILVPAAHQLQHTADVVDHHSRRWFGFRS